MRELKVVLYSLLLLAASSPVQADFEPGTDAALAWDSALMSIEAKDMAGSKAHLLKAIELEPEWAEPYAELGQLYFQLEKYGAAATEFARATKLQPNNAEWFSFLGNAYALQEKCSEASVALNQALKLDASLVKCYKMMAKCYYDDGDFASARDQYTAYVDAKPGDAKTILLLAETNKRLKKTGAAIKGYKKAIKADPKLFAAHNNLGNLYLENQDFAKAESALGGAVKLRPRHSGALFNLAIAIHSQSRLVDALAAYEKVVAAGGKSRKAKSTVAAAKGVIKDLKKAIADGAK